MSTSLHPATAPGLTSRSGPPSPSRNARFCPDDLSSTHPPPPPGSCSSRRDEGRPPARSRANEARACARAGAGACLVGRTRPIAVLSRRLAFFFHSRRHQTRGSTYLVMDWKETTGGGLNRKDRPENPSRFPPFIYQRTCSTGLNPACCLWFEDRTGKLKFQVASRSLAERPVEMMARVLSQFNQFFDCTSPHLYNEVCRRHRRHFGHRLRLCPRADRTVLHPARCL